MFLTWGKKKGRRSHAIAFQKSTHFSRFPISQETLRKSIFKKILLQALFQVDKTNISNKLRVHTEEKKIK